ncbi:MAG: GNAT family N-acetyltransferase [Actinomycetota bacterium]|nr:GNAT family N-acetyltransferase [Actinomycetota bacterium]
MADFAIRAGSRTDVEEIVRLDGFAFGFTMSPQDIEDLLRTLDPDRFLLATDADRIVGVTADFALTMTVPGGTRLAVPGVTWVSVAVTHRRMGILAALMRTQLEGYRAEGRPLAILTASESGIYGRFGYGPATFQRAASIERRRAVLREPGDTRAVRMGTAEQARAAVADVHRRWCEETPGAIGRSEAWWDTYFLDREGDRDGMTARFHLLHDDGYVMYRAKESWEGGHAHNVCSVTDVIALTVRARRDLWTVLLGLDLFSTVDTSRLPLDDPLPLLLTDPRQVRTTAVNDAVWVRLLDVPAALAARTYGVEIDTVLRVADAMFGEVTVRLRGGPDGAACEPTDAPADVHCAVSALGSAYLGGVRVGQLAAAGLVQAADPAALRRLDRAMLAEREPFHGTGF